MLDRTTDNDLTADELEQLAQSPAVDGSLGRADTLRVVEVLRALAAARRAGDDWRQSSISATIRAAAVCPLRHTPEESTHG